MSKVAEQVARATVHQHKDYFGAKIGMWVFLFTEVLLFGGLFLLYSVYRADYPEAFHRASKHLDIYYGTINTIILLTSSLTMALAIATFKKGRRGLCFSLLLVTVVCGFLFMGNKYMEWSHKIEKGIYPASKVFSTINKATGEPYYSKGEQTFYNLYYLMTGLHGIHVTIGMILLMIMAFVMLNRPNRKETFLPFKAEEAMSGSKMVLQGKDGEVLWESQPIDDSVKKVQVRFSCLAKEENIKPTDYVALENAGLYWHLVDLVWIFLFPLFYLIG